jgi:hypothetical protein
VDSDGSDVCLARASFRDPLASRLRCDPDIKQRRKGLSLECPDMSCQQCSWQLQTLEMVTRTKACKAAYDRHFLAFLSTVEVYVQSLSVFSLHRL